MPRVPMLPLHALGGELIYGARKAAKERGELGFQELLEQYGENGTKEFPSLILDEDDNVISFEGLGADETYLLLKVMFLLDLGMVKVKYLPRGRL